MRLLEKCGCHVDLAANGKEALDMAGRFRLRSDPHGLRHAGNGWLRSHARHSRTASRNGTSRSNRGADCACHRRNARGMPGFRHGRLSSPSPFTWKTSNRRCYSGVHSRLLARRVKLLIFSDIHGDKAALEKLMAIEADYYFAAGDLANWGRGSGSPGADPAEARRAHVCAAGQSRIGSRYRALLHAVWPSRFSRRDRWRSPGITWRASATPTPRHSTRPANTASRNCRSGSTNSRASIRWCSSAIRLPKARRSIAPAEGKHFGSEAIREFIEREQPRYFYCGHIHEAAGPARHFRAHPGVGTSESAASCSNCRPW